MYYLHLVISIVMHFGGRRVDLFVHFRRGQCCIWQLRVLFSMHVSDSFLTMDSPHLCASADWSTCLNSDLL